MPTYDYQCDECCETQTAIRKIADRKNGPECCGKQTKQIITTSNIQPVLGGGSFEGYKCVVTDEWVDSRKKRREIIAKHGLEEAG